MKSEFNEMLRYLQRSLEETGVNVRLGETATAEDLLSGGYDEIVIATGVIPREIDIPGKDHPKVLSYRDVLLNKAPVGRKVAIVGAGGIGFDMAEYLLGTPYAAPDQQEFMSYYGIDPSAQAVGGLTVAAEVSARREITILQRSPGRIGARLAVSTGWIHRQKLSRYGVRMLAGVTYERIDEEGLHILVEGRREVISADSIVICAGQESERSIYENLKMAGARIPIHLIGGADVAAELDAKRAIDQASRLAQII
jgi:2,4-dienoyl-CoA reductase (NADPH2)